jgi:hypothetical protein
MRKFTIIALLVVSALMLASQNAYAGGCRHGCGENRGEYDAPRPHWGTYNVVVPTYVSDHPRHGYGTDIRLKPGAVVQAKCSSWGPRWCKIRNDTITHAFVPRHCLQRVGYNGDGNGYHYRRHYRHHYRYDREYRESREGGFLFSEPAGNGNGNGYGYGEPSGHPEPYDYREQNGHREHNGYRD